MIRSALQLALAGALFLPTAFAGDSTQVLTRAKVEARLSSPWPGMLNKGWAPVRVELRNDSDRPRTVSIGGSCSDWQMGCTSEQRVELAPGEQADLELTLPTGGTWQTDWNFNVRSNGDAAYFSGVLSGGGEYAYCNVLVIGPDEVPASEVTHWQEQCSTTTVGYTAPGTTSTHDNIQMGFAVHGELPRSNTAYTSLDLVVIDARKGLPQDDKLEPLMAWVRSGGRLLLMGSGALDLAARNGALAPWLESRFALDDEGHHFICGLGQVVFDASDGGFGYESTRQLIAQHAEEDSSDVAPRTNGTSRTSSAILNVPGLGAIPHRIFALLLLGFALVIHRRPSGAAADHDPRDRAAVVADAARLRRARAGPRHQGRELHGLAARHAPAPLGDDREAHHLRGPFARRPAARSGDQRASDAFDGRRRHRSRPAAARDRAQP
ncbi:MAG: hypothetical protein NTV21_08635 [Planctomycetota bacterium]|nr:hypothetical protein [Planctomycetota bacterium]